MTDRQTTDRPTEGGRISVDGHELLRLLDHVDSLMRWCSANMPCGRRYTRGANAMWRRVRNQQPPQPVPPFTVNNIPSDVPSDCPDGFMTSDAGAVVQVFDEVFWDLWVL